MRVIVAATSFKGTLSAPRACRAIAKGITRAKPKFEISLLPVSDGGDGLVDSLMNAMPGHWRKMTAKVQGPLGDPVSASYLLGRWAGKFSAVIESASACGLALVPEKRRNPMHAASFGLGQLMIEARRHRVKAIYVGLGGTATIDAGCGMAQAMGARLLDASGRPIGLGCAWLGQIEKIELGKFKKYFGGIRFFALTDVRNPLLGARGAARVFGPQKGASPEQIEAIEKNMVHFSRVLRETSGKDVEKEAGAGAAGGLGAGLAAFCSAKLLPGVETVLHLIDAKSKIKNADAVVVGEGMLDATTLSGKAPQGTAALARRFGKKVYGCFGVAPATEARLAKRLGLSGYRTLLQETSGSRAKAMQNPEKYLESAAYKLFVKL